MTTARAPRVHVPALPDALRRLLRVAVVAAATVGGIVALVAIGAVLGVEVAGRTGGGLIGAPASVELGDLEQRSVIYAADGSELAVLHDEEDRRSVPLDEMPPHVRGAVLAAEDRRFYEHRGYDLRGTLRAVVANVRAGGVSQGGSTITQQLAKNNLVGGERSLERKWNELRYAMALERDYSKDELLERYLNQVYFGSGAYGIAAAAEEYFRKQPAELEVHEAALLAGLIRAPGTFDPRASADAAAAVRDAVIDGMVALGAVSADEAEAAKEEPVSVEPPLERDQDDPYVVAMVKRAFFDDPSYGETRQDRINLLFTGGLQVHTTIDPELQGAAETIIAETLGDAEGPTAAVASVDPRTGHVVAMASGADFSEEQFDLATQGRRQPGSAFKPFVLASALMQGVPLRLQVTGDSPTFFDDVPGWTEEDDGVRNFGDQSYGRVDLREATVRSVNTAFAELILAVGQEPVVAMADAMGIDMAAAMGPGDGPAIALGGLGNGVTVLEMASAYGVFGNAGGRVPPAIISRVVDRSGNALFEGEPEPQRVLRAEVNAAMVDVLGDVVRRGTATRAAIEGWSVAGKTGTTQESADAWFVGTTPVLSTAVWIGHPEGQVPMDGTTGGTLPAEIWRAFNEVALAGIEPTPFPDADVDFSSVETGGEVDVPDIVGMSADEALEALTEAMLVGVVREVAHAAEAGTVAAQSPRAGRTVPAGSDVVISVSNGGGAAPTATPTEEPSLEPETATARRTPPQG